MLYVSHVDGGLGELGELDVLGLPRSARLPRFKVDVPGFPSLHAARHSPAAAYIHLLVFTEHAIAPSLPSVAYGATPSRK